MRTTLLPRLVAALGVTILFLSVLFPATVVGMSAEQKKLFQSGILYFDINTCADVGAVANTGGNATGKVYLLGDSIAQGTQGELTAALTGKGFSDVIINALASRSLTTGSSDLNGLSVLGKDKGQWADANTVIIELGANGGVNAENIKIAMDTIKANNTTGAKVYWINTGANGGTVDAGAINTALQQGIAEGYTIIDWASQVAAHPDYIADDGYGVHASDAGKQPFAQTIADGAVGGGSVPAATANSDCACKAGSTIPLVGGDNAEKIFNFFVGKGLQPFQAAGIIGNMMAESGVEPMRLQGTTGDTTTPADQVPAGTSLGWGLVQWTPAHKMINPVRDAGKDPNDLGIQIDFLWEQLEGGGPIPEKAAGDKLKATTNAREAAEVFASQYERHAGPPQPVRGDFAESVLAQFGSNTGGSASGGTNACGGGGNGQVVGGYSLPVDRSFYDSNPEWFSKPHHADGGAASDIPVPEGTPVYAITAGKITKAPAGEGCGNGVIIEAAPGVSIQYCHGSDGGSVDGAKEGDTVQAGQLIMHSSWTGHVDPAGPGGTHLHVGLFIDGIAHCPQALFKSIADGSPIQDLKSLAISGCTEG